MMPLAIPLGVCALAVLVLVIDLVPGTGPRRGAAALAAVGLALLFVATWFVPTGVALAGAFENDAFTVYVQRVVLGAGVLAATGMIDHAERLFPRRHGEYLLLLLASTCGMVLLPGAKELITLIVAFELMGVPLYAMAALHKNTTVGNEGAVKLYVAGAVSAAITAYGLSFVIGATGETLFSVVRTGQGPMLVLGSLLMLAGMAYKLGAVPFHGWVPDTYQGAPAPFVAFLSVAPKAAGLGGLARLLWEAFPSTAERWTPILLALAILSMALGNALAIPQQNARRLLAYSGIGHMGLLLVALLMGRGAGIEAMVFYLATYVAANMGAFFVAEAVEVDDKGDIGAFNGLARRNPGLGLAMLLFLLSLGGIPFVAGFWGKMVLFKNAWLAGYTWFVLAGALVTVVGLFYYLRLGRAVYIEAPSKTAPVATGGAMRVAIVLAVLATVGMGVFPRPFIEAAAAAGAAIGR